MNNHLTTFEQSKKLKEAGVKIENPLFAYSNFNYQDENGAFVGEGKGVDNWTLLYVEDWGLTGGKYTTDIFTSKARAKKAAYGRYLGTSPQIDEIVGIYLPRQINFKVTNPDFYKPKPLSDD